MEPTIATPLIAVVEDDPQRASVLVSVLENAGYRVAWYRQSAPLLDDVMEHCPDVVMLASRHPQRYDRWQVAADLREMGCAVIMATASDAAMREVHVTPRGRSFVGMVRVPYDLRVVLATVAQALASYPYNIHTGMSQPAAHSSLGLRHVLRAG